MMHTPAGSGGQHEAVAESSAGELAAEVTELVGALFKAVRARQTYVAGNPLIEKFESELTERFSQLWNHVSHLTLSVEEKRFTWNGIDVYVKPLGPENQAFRFFRDGVRSIALLPGVEDAELREFLAVLASRRAEDQDILATLWHRDFDAIRMEYIDVTEDEGLEISRPERGTDAGGDLPDLSEVEEVLQAGPVSEQDETAFADLALGEADLLYLRREMEAEQGRPLVRDVTLALLDQFEMRDHERRRQVVDILREFLPRLLSARDFPNVAVIVNELQLLANKTGESETQELVASLLRDMSEAMAEMLSLPGGSEQNPAADEVDALLGALQAEAIPTLVRAIPSVPDPLTRRRLSEELDRLVASHPSHVRNLLDASDPVLAAEAARIIGRLRVREAEPALVELARRPEQVTRQAAIEALTEMGSLAGADVLKSALDDASREVRLAGIHAIVQLQPPWAEELLCRRLLSRQLDECDQAEQMTVFKAYATVAEAGGIATLDRVLNGRKWWGGRRSAVLRASAARALGLIAGDRARQVLQRAARDRAAPVKSAVRVALRALETGRASARSDEDEAEDRQPPRAVEGEEGRR